MDIPDEAMKGIPFGLGALRHIACEPKSAIAFDRLGLVGDRRNRTPNRPIPLTATRAGHSLHGGCGRGVVCDDARDSQYRPARHTCMRLRRPR